MAIHKISEAIQTTEKESVLEFFNHYDVFSSRKFEAWEWKIIFNKFESVTQQVTETISFHNSKTAALKAGWVQFEYLREQLI